MDASVLVAVLNMESGFQEFGDRAARADKLLTSAIARWETVRALTRERRYTIKSATESLDRLLHQFDVETVAISESEAALAIQAHAKYGKGNHPANLNMGDCFAYACAKANDARLLYKGDDFSKTDLA